MVGAGQMFNRERKEWPIARGDTVDACGCSRVSCFDIGMWLDVCLRHKWLPCLPQAIDHARPTRAGSNQRRSISEIWLGFLRRQIPEVSAFESCLACDSRPPTLPTILPSTTLLHCGNTPRLRSRSTLPTMLARSALRSTRALNGLRNGVQKVRRP